jgi:DNA-binding GntR family transcriptional regulator
VRRALLRSARGGQPWQDEYRAHRILHLRQLCERCATDLFDVRESLEVLAARLAADRADSAGLDALAAQLDTARRATKRGDKPAIAAANAGFRTVIVELAANPLLEAILKPLEARTQWLFHLTNDRDAGVQCCEHGQLLAAIADHDADRAAESAFHHVHSGRAASLDMAAQWSSIDIDPVQLTKGRRRCGS